MASGKIESVRALIDLGVLGSAEQKGLAKDAEIAEELRANSNNVCTTAVSYEQKLRVKLEASGNLAPAAVAPLLRDPARARTGGAGLDATRV
jgi:hypothetical protein